MTGPSSERTAYAEWFHEYGFSGEEDFEAVVAFADSHGFAFVYGGATRKPEWIGYPAEYEALVARNQQLQEALAAAVKAYDSLLQAERDDARMGYPLPGDSCLAAAMGLGADETFEKARAVLASVRARTPE